MRLKGYVQLLATLRLKSGLHIGTGEKEERGEAVPVIRSLRTEFPYIPGSSLKGKMRHLLEITYGRKKTKDAGSPCCCGECQICVLFGSGSSDTTLEPTRLIFRDCYLTESSETLLEKINLEEKPGVRIDRITGKAAGKALFPQKRVPEGCEFNFELSVRLFENDNLESIRQWLSMGLLLMEQDALGGSGTRGSGYIEFNKIKFEEKEFPPDWREQCKKDKEKVLNLQIKNNHEDLSD